MKNTMKSVLSTVGLVAMLVGFSTSASAIVWTKSPDSIPTSNTLTSGVTVVNGVNQIDFLESQTQPKGIYGAGFTVSGGGSQTIKFDTDLYSWDSYNGTTGYWDAFVVTISTVGYYWNLGLTDPLTSTPTTAVWTWGGLDWGTGSLETNITALGDPYSLTLNAGAPSLYYVSLALDTKTQGYADGVYPSWGTFQVEVPEPSMLGLLGIGLLAAGVAGRARRKNVA